jgi:toxin YoeB
MKLVFTPEAWSDYLYWQKQDKKNLLRINELIKDILRTPFNGLGKPEPLRYELQGCWSRRIDKQDRLVYQVNNDSVTIIAARFHYI